MPRDGNRRIARAKYRSKRVLASNVTFVKLEISQDLISRNLTRYKITRNVLKRLLRFLHLVLHLSTPFSPSSPRSRIHFRGVLPREKSSRGSSDSPPNGKRSSNPSVEKKQRGIVYCACPGTNFPTECQIFVLDNLCGGGGETFGKCIAATMGQNRTWNENFGRKDQVDEFSLSLSLLILHNSALELRHSRVSFILRLIGPVAGGILTSYRRWWWIFEFGESWETRICTSIGNGKKRRIVDRWLTENLRWKKNQFCMNVLRELHREKRYSGKIFLIKVV